MGDIAREKAATRFVDAFQLPYLKKFGLKTQRLTVKCEGIGYNEINGVIVHFLTVVDKRNREYQVVLDSVEFPFSDDGEMVEWVMAICGCSEKEAIEKLTAAELIVSN
jgi:hypothetical protein